ncbi:hypothetical protein F4604DRAFT_1908169 [Suillus subluteus]|nr:hypothetical protein F4604DRAFT_1908169 [Suillus subluteus]
MQRIPSVSTVFEKSGTPGPSKFEKFCIKRTLSQAEINHRFQTVTKAARKAHAGLLVKMTTPPPPPNPLPASTLRKSELLGLPRLMAGDVGVGEDWSHLDKRRQRSRKEKIERDLKWMWTLQAAARGKLHEKHCSSVLQLHSL